MNQIEKVRLSGRLNQALAGLFFLLLFTVPLFPAELKNVSDIVSVPVDLGSCQHGEVLSYVFQVTNRENGPLYMSFTSTCECLTLDPSELTVEPNDSAEITVAFDTAGYQGEVLKRVFVISSDENYHRQFITFEADVLSGRVSAGGSESSDGSESDCPECEEKRRLIYLENLRRKDEKSVLYGDFFYSAGCRECEKFLQDDLPEIQSKSQVPMMIRPRNIMQAGEFDLFMARAEGAGVDVNALPALFMNDTVYTGVEEIADAVRTFAAGGMTSSGPGGSAGSGVPSMQDPSTLRRTALGRLTPVPVFFAGLIDGINPCAFTTIIFMISILTLYGRSRQQMLLTGLIFSIAVFITYYMVGLGFFSVIRTAVSYRYISTALRWVLFAVLVVFAVISMYDGIMLRRGRSGDVILQLSGGMKRRIHKTVRGGVKSASLAAGAATMGIMVSLFELACTGQVYLPTITYMVTSGYGAGYLLLLLYNIGFILPLLGVFVLVYTGTGSDFLTAVFKQHAGTVKFSLAAVFLLLASLTLL